MRERFEPGFDRVLLSDQTVIVQLKSDQASDARRAGAACSWSIPRPARAAHRLWGLSSTDEYELVLINKDGRQIKTAVVVPRIARADGIPHGRRDLAGERRDDRVGARG